MAVGDVADPDPAASPLDEGMYRRAWSFERDAGMSSASGGRRGWDSSGCSSRLGIVVEKWVLLMSMWRAT